MNARFTPFFLVGTVLLAGCSARATLPVRGGAQLQTAEPTSAAVTSLTSEQQQEIETLRAVLRRKLTPVRPRLGAVQAELRRLWSAEKPDRDAILAEQKRLLKLVEKNLAVENDFHFGLRKVLSLDQRATILGDDMKGLGSGVGARPGERGAGIGQMTGGALGGGLSGVERGGGSGGFLTGCLGSLFGGEGDGCDEDEED